MSNYLGFIHNFLYSSKGFGSILSLPPLQHAVCLLDSDWYRSMAAAVLGSPPMVLESPKFWDLLQQVGYTLSLTASHTQALFLHGPFRSGASPATLAMPSQMASPSNKP